MNERALVAMSSVLPPPKKGEMVTVQLRFIVDGLPNENNEYVEWVLVALDGEAFDTKLRKHLELRYKLKDIDRLDYSGVNEQEIGQEDVGVLAYEAKRLHNEYPFVLNVKTTQKGRNGNKRKTTSTPGTAPRARKKLKDDYSRTFMNVVDKENFWTCFECEFTEHADGRVEPGKFKRWALQPDESKEAFEALCKKTYVDSHSLMDGTTLTIEHVSKDPKIKAHFYEHIDKAVKFANRRCDNMSGVCNACIKAWTDGTWKREWLRFTETRKNWLQKYKVFLEPTVTNTGSNPQASSRRSTKENITSSQFTEGAQEIARKAAAKHTQRDWLGGYQGTSHGGGDRDVSSTDVPDGGQRGDTSHEFLRQRLRQCALKEKVMGSDGNCQFRALADQLFGNENRYADCRLKIIEQLWRDTDHYKASWCDTDITRDGPWDSFVQRLGVADETGQPIWGGHHTLQAAADAYGVTVHVYSDVVGARDFPLKIESRYPAIGNRFVSVSHISEMHYNSVINYNSVITTAPLALGAPPSPDNAATLVAQEHARQMEEDKQTAADKSQKNKEDMTIVLGEKEFRLFQLFKDVEERDVLQLTLDTTGRPFWPSLIGVSIEDNLNRGQKSKVTKALKYRFQGGAEELKFNNTGVLDMKHAGTKAKYDAFVTANGLRNNDTPKDKHAPAGVPYCETYLKMFLQKTVEEVFAFWNEKIQIPGQRGPARRANSHDKQIVWAKLIGVSMDDYNDVEKFSDAEKKNIFKAFKAANAQKWKLRLSPQTRSLDMKDSATLEAFQKYEKGLQGASGGDRDGTPVHRSDMSPPAGNSGDGTDDDDTDSADGYTPDSTPEDDAANQSDPPVGVGKSPSSGANGNDSDFGSPEKGKAVAIGAHLKHADDELEPNMREAADMGQYSKYDQPAPKKRGRPRKLHSDAAQKSSPPPARTKLPRLVKSVGTKNANKRFSAHPNQVEKTTEKRKVAKKSASAKVDNTSGTEGESPLFWVLKTKPKRKRNTNVGPGYYQHTYGFYFSMAGGDAMATPTYQDAIERKTSAPDWYLAKDVNYRNDKKGRKRRQS